MNNRLIKSNDAGGGACTNTVDLYNPFPDGGGVALYQLNGDATDVSGNYDGSISGTIPFVTGVFGQAAQIGPSNDYINTTINPSSFSVATVSCWFKRNGIPTNSRHMIWGTATTTDIFGIVEVGSDVYIADNTGTSFPVSNFNDWNHIVIVADNSVFSTYLNGQLIDSNLPNTLPSFSNTISYLGRSSYGDFHQMNGDLDQVRIFNRALRPYEVEALYTEEYCTPTIVPSEHFNTVLYTGTNNTNPITTVGFQPDLVWIKNRFGYPHNHSLSDSVRGAEKKLYSNLTNAEAATGGLASFDNNGFTLDSSSANDINEIGFDYVAWNFKAGGAAATNTDGTITSQVSANTEAGFSIVSYTGNGVSGATRGHGLGVVPNMIIIKNRDNGSASWPIYHSSLSEDFRLDWPSTGAASSTGDWNNTAPTTTTFTTNNGTRTNASGQKYIAYCFAEVEGFSSFGSYVGTGASGNTVVTGFEPAFVMIKRTDSTSQWLMYDNKRGEDYYLYPNLSAAESGPDELFQFLENGFQLTGGNADWNASGGSYIYMAFASDPTTVEPTLEDSFNTVTYTGNGGTQSVTGVGFQPDLVWVKNRQSPPINSFNLLFDSVRGATKWLSSNATNVEGTIASSLTSFNSDGFSLGTDPVGGNLGWNINGNEHVAWNWKGAELPAINSNGSIPSVVSANPAAGFSIVSYANSTSGTADQRYTIGHGLDSAPDLIITKVRNVDGYRWTTYNSFNGIGQYMALNETRASTAFSRAFPVAPTSSVFTLDEAWPHPVGGDAITYCFHSVAGFSKFGSYTGTGGVLSEQTLGFEPAFIMFKRTDSTGDWFIYDNKRDTTDPRTVGLYANLSAAEYNTSGSPGYADINFLSNGFSMNANYVGINGSGGTFIYMAFANQF